MTRYTVKKRGARKKATTKRPSVSPSLKGWITKWNHEVAKLLKKKRPSKKVLERLKALRKRLKEARALSHKPKAKKGQAAHRKPKKGLKAKERVKSPKKRPRVKKPSSRPKKRPQLKKPRKRPDSKKGPKKRSEPKKRPKPKKPIIEPERPQEESKLPVPPPVPPQVPEAVPEQRGAPQEPGTPQEPQEPQEEEFKEAKKRFEEALRKYERERLREKDRRTQVDKELNREIERLEAERIKIFGAPDVLPTPVLERLGERFDELLDIAERTGQIWVAPVDETIDSEASFGVRAVVPIKEYLTEETIEEIIYRIEQGAKKIETDFPIWIALFMYSAAGRGLFGYAIKTLLADDVDALKFQVQGLESTGIFPHRASMIAAIRISLEAMLDMPGTLIYLHFSEIRNYERKSGEQQKKWRKEKRERYREEKSKKQGTHK